MLCILCEAAQCIEDEVTCDDCADWFDDYSNNVDNESITDNE
jgi:hypothetical protein